MEGVYLSWRGDQYLQTVGNSDETKDQKLHEDFNHEDLVDHKLGLPGFMGTPLEPLKIESYFSIKDRAELQVSRVELARAVFGLAYAVKNPKMRDGGSNNYVFVLGHSFGALALEQTLGQASVGLLSAQWAGYPGDRWPFDLIVFLNSAAPSLYAKQLQDFFINDTKTTSKPRIVSITSTGDWATGIAHHVGNLPNRYFASDLQRVYHPASTNGRTYTAGYYYDFTPGHNNLLINGCISEDCNVRPPPGLDTDHLFEYNLANCGTSGTFYAQDYSKPSMIDGYRLYSYVRCRKTGAITVLPGTKHMQSNYWILTVPPEIIPNHFEIWTDTSMEMLAAIYSIVRNVPTTYPLKSYPAAAPN